MSDFEVQPLSAENVGSVPELLYRGYGYTYTDEWMYDPEKIMEASSTRKYHFWLGIDKAGKTRAIVAMRFPYPSRSLGELGTLVADPAIREIESGQIIRQMAVALGEKALAMAMDSGLKALISTESTAHQLTQRLVNRIGFTPCGIFLAWLPAWAEHPQSLPVIHSELRGEASISEEFFLKRRAETVSALPFWGLFQPYEVSLPARFEKLTRLIYDKLKLPVEFVPFKEPAAESKIECTLNFRRSFATVELLEVGEDAPTILLERLEHYRNGRVDLIHFVLPLAKGDINPCVDALISLGCKFAALLPCYRDSDVIVLQFLNNVEVNLTEDQLYSEMTKTIFRSLGGQTLASYLPFG